MLRELWFVGLTERPGMPRSAQGLNRNISGYRRTRPPHHEPAEQPKARVVYGLRWDGAARFLARVLRRPSAHPVSSEARDV